MRGNLRISVKDASGLTPDGTDAWGEKDMDLFVKIELKAQTPGTKSPKQATSTVKADGARATWNEQLVLPVLEGTEELRVILCKSKKGHFNTGVVAAAGIYVQDIVRAVPIDKHFQLFKPGEGGDAGFIRLAMNFSQGEPVPAPAPVARTAARADAEKSGKKGGGLFKAVAFLALVGGATVAVTNGNKKKKPVRRRR